MRRHAASEAIWTITFALLQMRSQPRQPLSHFAPKSLAFDIADMTWLAGARPVDGKVRPRLRDDATHAATHFLTVSHVRVVISRPNAVSSNFMNTGPLALGT